MRKIMFLGLSIFLVCLYACSGNKSEDPKKVAQSFYEALSKKDYDKAAQFATRDSKTLLDLIKSMGEISKQLGNADAEDDANEKMKRAVFSDAIIDGDRATVKVTYNHEENLIKLKKEDGFWKVALDKDSLNNTANEESGINLDDVNSSMDEALRKVEEIPIDSIQNAINQAAELMKSDTMKNVLKKAGKLMKKAGQAMEEAGKQ